MKRYTIYLVLVLVLISSMQEKLLAQDKGPPAMQIIAISSIGGAGLGVFLGAAIWLLDPLAENADIRNSILGTMGYGALIGTGVGVFQLQKTMVLPAAPEIESEIFEEEIGYRISPVPGQMFFTDKPKKYARGIPLLQFKYRF